MFNGTFVTKPRTNQPHGPGQAGKYNTFNQFEANSSDRDIASHYNNNRAGTTNSDGNPIFNMTN